MPPFHRALLLEQAGKKWVPNGGYRKRSRGGFGVLMSPPLDPPYAGVVIADGPIGYWRLNESGGNVAFDSSGHNNHLSVIGAGPQKGQPGLLVDDPDLAAVWSSGANTLDGGNVATWDTALVSLEAIIQTTSSATQMIFCRDTGGTGHRAYQYRVNGGALELLLWTVAGGLQVAVSSVLVNDGLPHHVVGAFDGTNIKVYVDGALRGTTANSGTMANGDELDVGDRGGTLPFVGTMDELAVYDYGLTAAQVLAHFEASGLGDGSSAYRLEVEVDSPLVWYRLGELAGSTVVDASSNGRNGSLQSGPTLGAPGLADDDDYAITTDGSDGSGNYVLASTDAVLIPKDFAHEVWVKGPFIVGGIVANSHYPVVRDTTNVNGYYLSIGPVGGNLNFVVDGTAYDTGVSNATVRDGHKHHLVWEIANTVARLYVDGALAYSTAITAAASRNAPATGWRLARDGNRNSLSSYYLGATYDEWVIYQSLSAARVAAHYAAAPVDLYMPEVLADSPIAYWRMDEGAGTVMADSSGNARHGAYVATPTLGASQLVQGAGLGVTLNGSTQYGSITDSAVYDVDQITVEAWVKTTTALLSMIVGRDTSFAGSGQGRSFQLRVFGGLPGIIVFTGGSPGNLGTTTTQIDGPSSIANGAVHHVVGTYDGTTVRLYVDGVQVASAVVSGFLGYAKQPMIGGRLDDVDTPPTNPYAGTVGHVAYYGTALSAGRIAAHYAAGI